MAKWSKLDTKNKDIEKEPWDLYWTEWKSNTKEFEDFLHSPKNEAISSFGADDSYAIQTTILNHEAGLLGSAVCGTALVDPNKKIVYFTLYKHFPDQ